MTSKTLDFSSWYELQADSDSDDGSVNACQTFPSSYSSLSTYPASDNRHAGRASLIQQLLDEMDDANQKIDQYTDGKKSDGGTSLEEFPMEESGRDEMVSSAIAEVSKDFITGNLSTGPLASGESDESHLSSDNDLRHRRGAAYAKYPETAAGLSDNDWNPYVTESDTNTSPRLNGEFRPTSVLASGSDSKVSSLVSSFNPPLCSTKFGSNSRFSKTSLQLTDSRPAAESSLHLSDIQETSGLSSRSIASLKPDSSISPPQLTSSKLSEYSFGQSRDETAQSLRRCFERTSWPPSPEKESGSPGKSRRDSYKEFRQSLLKLDSGFDYTRMEESFKELGNFGDAQEKSSWEIKSSLPGRGYFSDAVQSALSSAEQAQVRKTMTDLDSGQKGSSTGSSALTFSAEYGGEKLGTDIRMSGDTDAAKKTELMRTSRDSARTSGSSSSTETVIPARALIRKESDSTHNDRLSQQVDKLLQETAYLTNSSRAKLQEEKKAAEVTTTALDYDRLHRDLQEIQDSLHTMGQPTVSGPVFPTTTISTTTSFSVLPASSAAAGNKSDSDDTEIVPSTTTTPERGRRLMWDYAADLGYGHSNLDRLEGMMSDTTTEASPLDSRHPDRHYTSDGEETRTSSLDHAGEEEEHHEGPNLTLTTELAQAAAIARGGTELDDLLSTFLTETHALGNRDPAVRSQGMADKVISILSSTNPDQQAQGILSRIRAEEQEIRHQQQTAGKGYDRNQKSSPSNALTYPNSQDPVRKRLDMSSVSDSGESSQLMPSFLEPKLEAAFSATSYAQSLISTQMKKMADRTFNHSIELRTPVRHEAVCYPVYSSKRDNPQHQQLQQQLQQQQLQQQQQPKQLQREQTAPKVAWAEKEEAAGAKKSPREVLEKQFEELGLDEKEKKSDSEEDSPSGTASPSDSDRSSELRRGKYRPYRPAGSQDVYYTESDTASVAESVTTIESTHTGSDDAVGPHFPSSVLGSRHDPAGAEPGIYTKRSKPAGPAGASIDPNLTTIEERATPDARERSSSDSSSKAGTGLDSAGFAPPTSGTAGHQAVTSISGMPLSVTSSSVTDITAKRQTRAEDSSTKIPVPVSTSTKVYKDPLTKGEAAHRAQQSDVLRTGPSTSPDSVHRSRIPVRGPPPNYTAALRSKQEDRERGAAALLGEDGDHNTHNVNLQPSFTDQLTITRPHLDQPDGRANDSGETRLLQAIDAQVEKEILEKQNTGSSSDHSDDLSKRPQATASGGSSAEGGSTRNPSREDTQQAEHDRWRREAEAAAQQAEGRLEVDGALSSKRQEEAAILLQRAERRRQASREAAQGRAEIECAAEEKRQEELERRQRLQRQELKSQIENREKEVDEAVADKRREEVELERQRLDAQIAQQRESMQAAQLAREQELQEAQARRELLISEAEARRAAGIQREEELKRELERERELIAARRETELRSQREIDAQVEADLREEEELRREICLRREAENLQREAENLHREVELKRVAERCREADDLLRETDLEKEATQRKETELLRAADRQIALDLQREAERQKEAIDRQLELREAERLKEAAARQLELREAERRKEAADRQLALEIQQEAERRKEADLAAAEALHREVQRSRDQALRRQDPLLDARRQREAEEAILRAGGAETGLDQEADQEMLQRGHELVRRQEAQEAADRQPVSHRAQLLREALQHEPTYQGCSNLQFLWERFLRSSTAADQAEPDSSLGSEKVDKLIDLMRDPTQHLVHSFLSQRQVQHREDQQRAAAHREAERHRQQEDGEVQEREARRQEARRQQQRQSSEEESNGSYGEILQQRERDRQRRREARNQRKKVPGKSTTSTLSPALSPSPARHNQHLKSQSPSRGGDNTVETLYSIPEDTNSQDGSPLKSRSPHRSRPQQPNRVMERQSDVIDPYMDKLRQRIHQQREKLSKERVKEARRHEKLDKLRALLSAKRTGLMDDSTISAHLAAISSTSAPSSDDSVQTLTRSAISTDNTTTAKDSSTEMHRAKLARTSATDWRGLKAVEASIDTDDFVQLMEDSSSMSESDYSARMDQRYRGSQERFSTSRRHISPVSQLTKHSAKMLKLHQLYSPYQRGESVLPSRQSRLNTRSPPGKVMKDTGTMYPSPKRSPPSQQTQHRRRGSTRLISQGVQTSPDSRKWRSPSPPPRGRKADSDPRQNQGRGQRTKARQSSSPQMKGRQTLSHQERPVSCSPQSRGVGVAGGRQWPGGKMPRQSRSVSPAFDSSQVAACLSPDRDRPRSVSPERCDRRGQRSPSPSRQRSPSPVELRLKAWTEREARSPLRDARFNRKVPPGQHCGKSSPQGRARKYDNFDIENQLPSRQRKKLSPAEPASAGLTWFIPMQEDKPWRKPLIERQQHQQKQQQDAGDHQDWRPMGLSQKQWRELARADLEGLGGGLRGSVEGDTARLYLHRATKEAEEELGQQYDKFDDKPLCRMSLQEALMNRRPEFVSAMRQRQKRVQLAAENRQLQALVRAEQERIFADQRKISANPDAHPYSDNLYHPKRRVFSKQEMKEMTEKKYKCLPEVKEKEIEKKRSEEYRMNRLRAKVFNKRVQRKVLEKNLRCR